MSTEIDDLEERINTATLITTDIIDAMNTLALSKVDVDVAISLEISVRAINGSRVIGYRSGEATALLRAGTAASKQHHYDEAIDYYQQALSIYREMDNEHEQALTLSKMGNTRLADSKYSEALDFYNTAIEILKETNDESALANLYANSGLIYGLQGNYFLALKSQMAALKTYERLNNSSRIAAICSNIGIIYHEQQNYEEALKTYQRALKILTEAGDQLSECILLGNIGNVYQDQKKYDEALKVNLQALRMLQKIGDKAKLAYTYSNLGNAYKALDNNLLALEYYNLCLVLFLNLNEKRGMVQSYNNLGELYFELKEYKEAHKYFDEAVKLAEETGWKIQLRIAYEYLSQLYAEEGKYEEAYQYRLRFSNLDKEISNAETSRQIAQMTLRYEMEQRDQAAEIERVKNMELQKAFNLLEIEKKRSEELLLNILPEEISYELKEYGKTKARSYDIVTVLFMDIKGFTKISEQFTAEEIVSSIGEYFEIFDLIVEKHEIEKIKTIGDAYLCVSGLPIASADHAEKMIYVAKDFIQAVHALKEKRLEQGKHIFDFRVGINSGPVAAGVVGTKKFAYDIWGDTVNTASRMQSNGEPGRINISHSTYQLVCEKFTCTYRGEIEAKNKGKLKMYFVE
jgi:class 3 adenylate cyclase/uncharacterized protein HemY